MLRKYLNKREFQSVIASLKQAMSSREEGEWPGASCKSLESDILFKFNDLNHANVDPASG